MGWILNVMLASILLALTYGQDICVPSPPSQQRFCRVRRSFRTLNGSCNNLRTNFLFGAAGVPFIRLIQGSQGNSNGLFQGTQYAGRFRVDTPRGFPTAPTPFVPTPHEVSQGFFRPQSGTAGNSNDFSVMHNAFGQFLDHDMTLQSEPPINSCTRTPRCRRGSLFDFQPPCFPITFPPNSRQRCTPLRRSRPLCNTGVRGRPRQQVNTLTSFLDASMVYGNSVEQLRELANLRTGDMLTSRGNLLPFEEESEQPCQRRGGCFLTGDERGNENNGLVAMHTIFVREHNRIAAQLRRLNRRWSGVRVLLETRKIIGGILQNIVYSEYIQTLTNISPYKGYNSRVDATIANSFSAAAYRFGHSEVPNLWAHLDAGFNDIIRPVPLQNMFFDNRIIFQRGIEPITFGFLGNQTETTDRTFAFGLNRRLFVPPGRNILEDLMAINLQRGRDHGVPSYFHYRRFCNLGSSTSFNSRSLARDIPSRAARNRLRSLYRGRLDQVDLFAGGIAERRVFGKAVGRTFGCIIRDQFERLRDGDRFYYENPGVFTSAQLAAIRRVTMSRVLCNNLEGIVSIQRNAFISVRRQGPRVSCGSIPQLDLTPFREVRRRGRRDTEAGNYSDEDVMLDEEELDLDDVL